MWNGHNKLGKAVWLSVGLTAALIAVVVGCGGGGGGGTPTGGGGGGQALAAKGKVKLPAGFKLPLSQLQVLSDASEVNIGADGSFTAQVNSAGPHVVYLEDKKSGKIAMLGYVDPSPSGSPFANSQGSISSASTADALIFMALLGPMLPTQSWTTFLKDIVGSSYETQVAAAVNTSLAANPTALTDGEQPILKAITAIQESYTGPSDVKQAVSAKLAASKQLNGPGAAVQQVVVHRNSETGALIKVEPIAPQSTLIVAPNPNGDGIVPVSTSRRRGSLFIYKVGAGPSANQITPIIPPQVAFSDVEIEPTEAIEDVQTGVFNGLKGKFAYLPLTNAPILLQPDPIQEVAVYDVVAIGPGKNDNLADIEAQVCKDSPESVKEFDTEWRAALLKSRLDVVFKDVVDPIITEWAVGLVEESILPTDSALEGVIETAAHSAPGFAAAIDAGDLKGAATALMTAFGHNSGNFRTNYIAALSKKFVSTGKFSPAEFQTLLQKASNLVEIIGFINKGIAVVDITQAFHDNTNYDDANLWVADVLQPVVSIIPLKSSVDTFDPLVHLRAAIQNVTNMSTFRFQWTCTNLEGKLESSTTTAPLGTGIVDDYQPVYVTDFTKFAVGTVDTITVTVFDENDLSTPLGTATATIKGAPAPCTTTPPAPVSVGPAAPTVTLSETSTRPGDLLTVTVAFPADPSRDQGLEIDLFSAPGDFTAEANVKESAKLIKVDGAPAPEDTKHILFSTTTAPGNLFPIASATIAQTHTLVFQMLEPTDKSGLNEEPYCSSDTKNAYPPYVLATGVGDSGYVNSIAYRFLNENP